MEEKRYIVRNRNTGRYLVYDFKMRSNSICFSGFDIKMFERATIFTDDELHDLCNEFWLFRKYSEFENDYEVLEYNIELRRLKLMNLYLIERMNSFNNL